jgi:ABC-type oligopeptide transport system ATPase subunit
MLDVRHLVKQFPKRGGMFGKREVFTAVDDVSFQVNRGTTLALVGESGSGKSTVGMMLLGLLETTSGDVLYEGRPVIGLRGTERLALRRKLQVVFQDPFASLNARMTVAELVMEGMRVHKMYANDAERRARAQELLGQVGFSGGQRQRIAIARALSVEPEFLVLDEPTSALDVSVQSQVLNLLRRLQRERGLTYLFVTHNLAVVDYLADEVCVMEKGKIIERGMVEDVFDHPQHATTQRLLAAVPKVEM